MRSSIQTGSHDLYQKAFCRLDISGSLDKVDKDLIKKAIFCGVRIVNTKPEPKSITSKEAIMDFRFADAIKCLMGTLTPGEFVNLFPITKDFNGHKYQCKDYFYTRDYIRSLSVDKTISESVDVMEFLWEYQNWEIANFLVNVFGYVNNLRRLEGQPSMMESFCDEMGIKTYTMHTDQKGKQFMVDRQTGRSFRVKNRRPRYLKPVS